MKKYIAVVVLVLAMAANTKAQFVGLGKAETNRLKALVKTDKEAAKLYAKYLKEANEALDESPNPRDTIVSEGHLKGDPDKTASLLAMKDYPKIYALALAYCMVGNKKYLDKATAYLVAWASTNHPTGNPINDTKMDDVMMAYDMIRAETADADRQTIDKWLMSMAELEEKKGKKGKTTTMNNWHSHRLKVVGQVGFVLNEKKYIDYAISGIETQIETNLYPDGSSFDFWERDALHYHLYDLEPLATLAIIIKRATGKNEFIFVSPKGSSIKKSVDWLLPYVTGEKTHEEYVNSKVAFDRARANNNEKDFAIGHLFQPEKALYLLSLATYFDKSYLPLINKAKEAKEKDNEAGWQLVLDRLTE